MSKEYKVIVKEVLKFRDGTSEERTLVERSTSELQVKQDEMLKWEEQHNPHLYPEILALTEPIALHDILNDIDEELNA